ncbi:conserved hypothetical protein [Clostridium botulinum C str. Eklund]|nr:conserved hypothetical protein [Clostridium botulinum C str. Eklund]
MKDDKIIKKGLIDGCTHQWEYVNNAEMIINKDKFNFIYTKKCNKCEQIEKVILNKFIS